MAKIVNVDIKVADGDYDRIKNAPGATTNVFSDICGAFVHEFANGGIVLKSSEVNRLAKNLGRSIAGSKDVIETMESTVGMKNGDNALTFSVDPAMVGPIKDFASAQGRTVEELCQDVFYAMLVQGYIYSFIPADNLFVISASDKNWLKEELGMEKPNGTAIIDKLKSFVENE